MSKSTPSTFSYVVSAALVVVALIIFCSWTITPMITGIGTYISEQGLKSIVSDIWLGSESSTVNTEFSIEDPNAN